MSSRYKSRTRYERTRTRTQYDRVDADGLAGVLPLLDILEPRCFIVSLIRGRTTSPMDDGPSAIHDFLEDFLDTYAREKEFYATMSREIARKCELQLARSGIQASITSRVKEEESLKREFLQRNKTKRYKHAGDIREDIVDFAGVRIALYFPNHVQKTEELTREIFLVRGTVHHGD